MIISDVFLWYCLSLFFIPFMFLVQSHSLAWNSPSQLGCQANMSQSLDCKLTLSSPSPKLQGIELMLWLLQASISPPGQSIQNLFSTSSSHFLSMPCFHIWSSRIRTPAQQEGCRLCSQTDLGSEPGSTTLSNYGDVAKSWYSQSETGCRQIPPSECQCIA